jgi:phage protein D
LKPSYKLTIGSTTIDSTEDLAATVVSIRIEIDMAVPASRLANTLGNVNGLTVAEGDPVAVELGYAEDGLSPVLEGAAEMVKSGIADLQVEGLSPMTSLLDLRLHQTYEKQTAGDIVSDLAGQAGVATGQIEDGIEFPVYVVDDGKNAYEHARILAQKCGFDLYLDVDNNLMFLPFDKTSADHTFEFGGHILSADAKCKEQAYQRVEVWGESPSSSQGEDAASWLTKTPQDFMGQAGEGEPLLLVKDRSIRTKAAADTSAQARLRRIERETLTGTLAILGAPQVALGDAIEVAGMPDSNANGIFQVRRIHHRLSKTAGFVTTIGWMGL